MRARWARTTHAGRTDDAASGARAGAGRGGTAARVDLRREAVGRECVYAGDASGTCGLGYARIDDERSACGGRRDRGQSWCIARALTGAAIRGRASTATHEFVGDSTRAAWDRAKEWGGSSAKGGREVRADGERTCGRGDKRRRAQGGRGEREAGSGKRRRAGRPARGREMCDGTAAAASAWGASAGARSCCRIVCGAKAVFGVVRAGARRARVREGGGTASLEAGGTRTTSGRTRA